MAPVEICSDRPRRQAKAGEETVPLVVLTINLQYFASWPSDEVAARQRLLQIVSAEPQPDVVCVQEGLHGRDVLLQVGYRRLVSSAAEAQSVRAMVYDHKVTLDAISERARDELLVNELYVRDANLAWEVVDHGVVRTSSKLSLVGGENVSGPLAARSVVWARFRPRGCPDVPAAIVLNTHISGGRFEDQFFVQQLAEERRLQVDRALDVFEQVRGPKDLGILVGDFNATTDDRAAGPVGGYFRSAIRSSVRVQEDARAARIGDGDLEAKFRDYMAAPFEALERHSWKLAYSQDEVGPTSAFGHCVDYMAMSRLVQARANVFETTRQRFGGGEPDTGLQLTDHNAVKVVFSVPCSEALDTPRPAVGAHTCRMQKSPELWDSLVGPQRPITA